MTAAQSPGPAISAAPAELAALACAMRPDWDAEAVADAILAARHAGWTWDHVLAETVRLMRSPDGSPRDLRRAAADPLRREVPPGEGRPRNPEYLAARERIAALPPLPEHRSEHGGAS